MSKKIMFWFYTLRATWRITRGRWYVWRDAPDDVVRTIAATWRWAKLSDDMDTIELARQARSEWALRKRKQRA